MKKSKILVVGLIGLLMAVGLVLAGCREPGCTNDGECEFRLEVLGTQYYAGNPRVDNVCGDSDCNVYKARAGTGSSSSCNCFHK